MDRKKRNKLNDISPVVYGKVSPQAVEIEKAVLGALMLKRDAYEKVTSIIKDKTYFYKEAHQMIFSAIDSLGRKGHDIDILTVSEELRKTEELELVGGSYYVTGLTNDVVSDTHIESHCRIILQKAILRNLAITSSRITQMAYEDSTDPFELIQDAGRMLSEVDSMTAINDMVPIDSVLIKAIQNINNLKVAAEERNDSITITGVGTGFNKLDIITRGWQPGDLIIVAARPSVGKSAFALSIVQAAAEYFKHTKQDKSVGVWSLEMTSDKMILRMLAKTSEIWLMKLQTGRLSDEEMKTVYTKGVQQLAKMNIYFDDGFDYSINQIRVQAKKMKNKKNLGLIVVDYLQLVSSEEGNTREQEISNISRSLKKLAKELQVPVIALSQLSRRIEDRPSREPQLSDLRESGAIEQDADMVIFLYPANDAQINENASLSNRRYVKIAKNRDGGLITMETDFDGSTQSFQEIEEYTRMPPSTVSVGVGSRMIGDKGWQPFDP